MSTASDAAAGMPRPWYEQQPARFAIETVRGVGQVDLQDKLVTGAFITVALFSAGWKPGVFGLLGAATSTGTAIALGVDRRRIYMGLEGYCGALIGIAAVTCLGLHLSSWLVAIAGGIACTVITATMATTLGLWGLPPLTGPFLRRRDRGCGAILRTAVGATIDGHMRTPFPLGTFAVNMSGSFLIGLLYERALQATRGCSPAPRSSARTPPSRRGWPTVSGWSERAAPRWRC